MTDTVTAKLAEWEARLSTERALRKGDPYYSTEAGAWDRDSVDLDHFTALLGFVKDVLREHEPRDASLACECGRLLPKCPTRQAARKWIGGEG